jgi:amidase/aspartyl-tRNA(Asn)/glutamyl-tRNA(Gln) amidotransferase subunit A
MSDICFLPATVLAQKIAARELKPTEVTEAFLDRIDALDGSLGAYTTVLWDGAREAAKRAEQQVVRREALGPLHGVPIAIKDLEDHKAGVRSTFGSKAFEHYVPDTSAVYVERLERAGAIVLGKTNCPEFGHKATTDNLLFGPTRNPFDLTRNAGGSSGGSAAAVAAGLAALAQGSDGGGSIRIPAAMCGVVGMSATFGRVPAVARPNAFSYHTPFVCFGPLARHVADAALMLSVMSGAHPRDPFSLPDDGSDFLAATSSPIEGCKIAYSVDFGVFPVTAPVRSLVAEAVSALREIGAEVTVVEAVLGRPQAELSALWHRERETFYLANVHSFLPLGVDLLGDDAAKLTPQFAALLERAQRSARSAESYKRDDEIRSEVYDSIAGVLDDYDLIVTATVSVPSVVNGLDGETIGPVEVDGIAVDPFIGWTLTYPVNFTGHPAISVPAGFTEEGWPVGMQMIGRRFDETTLFAVAAALERSRPWADRYPPAGLVMSARDQKGA